MQKLIKQERLSYTMEIFKEICQVIGLTLLWQQKYKNTKNIFLGNQHFHQIVNSSLGNCQLH